MKEDKGYHTATKTSTVLNKGSQGLPTYNISVDDLNDAPAFLHNPKRTNFEFFTP